MRNIKENQMTFGQVDIGEITFHPRCRDEIPKLLRGLQHIYCTPEIKEKVFSILQTLVPEEVNTEEGRPGMDLWTIFVLGTMRLSCNWDYDKLQEMANNHNTLRRMVGIPPWDYQTSYALQTLKDNVALLTPEILDRINRVVVEAGHALVKKKRKKG
jgi:hypothetical protein